MTEQGNREVQYANKNELIDEIIRKYHPEWTDAVEDNESENNTSSGQYHVKVEKPTENTAEENIPDSTQESKEQEKVSNIKIEPPSRKEGEQDR